MNFWEFCDKHLDRIDFKHVMGLFVVGATFLLFYLVMFNKLPEDADKYASQIITALNSIQTMVLGYWFISSAAKKDLPHPPGTTIEETTVTKKMTDTTDITPDNI